MPTFDPLQEDPPFTVQTVYLLEDYDHEHAVAAFTTLDAAKDAAPGDDKWESTHDWDDQPMWNQRDKSNRVVATITQVPLDPMLPPSSN